MFGIGMPEMLMILAVALIVIGPKKLPDLAKSLGKAMGEFKRATNDLKESIQIDNELDDVRHSVDELNQEIKEAGATAKHALDSTPDAHRSEIQGQTGDTDSIPSSQDPLDDVKQTIEKLNQPSNTDAADNHPKTREDNSA